VKVVLFCGGMGLRLREASTRLPKPLIPVGDTPILLNLMKYYAYFGHREFILCLGHKAQAIKEYFLNYDEALQNDFELRGREVKLLREGIADWKITFVDTGRNSSIGERLVAVRHHLADEDYFLANYGDQLTDAPLPDVVDRLKREDKVASLLCVPPPYSTHVLGLADDDRTITDIAPMNNGMLWINGGFFVLRRDIFEYIRPGEDLVDAPFRRLIERKLLVGYRYQGFWAPMDTLKDKQLLDSLADSECPPWAVWLNSRGDEPIGHARLVSAPPPDAVTARLATS
jgi:glucose-1-phosphate cytidylyltransferase